VAKLLLYIQKFLILNVEARLLHRLRFFVVFLNLFKQMQTEYFNLGN